MAYGTNVLFTGTWGSGPAIGVEFSYNKYRSGANMVYRVYVEIKPVSGYSYFGYPIQVSANVAGQVNTQTVKNASPSQWTSSIKYDSGDITVANKTSGTTPLSITLTGVDASRGSQTYTYNLPIDPAMSPVSATNINVGNATTITISKSNSSFTHTLQGKIGNATNTTLVSKTSASTYSWTPDANTCYTQMGNNKSVSILITCITYSGNTEIGRTTTTITATATASQCNPTVSITVAPVTARTALTGNANTLINNDAGIKITGTSTAKNGATISKNSIIVDGTTYNGTTKTLTAVSTGTFKFSATDSRGFSNTASVNRTVIKYIRPTVSITNPSVSTGGVATFTVKGNWFNGSFGSQSNSLTIQYGYKETGSSDTYTWATATATSSGNTYSANVSISGLDYTKQYSFRARVDDKLYSAYSNEAQAQAIPLFDWGKNDFQFNVRTFIDEDLYFGKENGSLGGECGQERRMIFETAGTNQHKSGLYGGNPNSIIALGAYDWNNNNFIWRYTDVNNALLLGGDANKPVDIYANGSQLKNFIIDCGTTDGWYWRKYKDGTVELFATKSFSGVNASKNHYSGFYYSDAQGFNYPFTLKSVITGEISGGSTNLINFVKPVGFQTNKFSYWLCGLDGTATNCSGSIYIHIIGTM